MLRTARSRELGQKLWIYSVVHDEAGRDLKSIFSPNSDSSSTKGTFFVGTLSLFLFFSVGLTFGAEYPLIYNVGVGHSEIL